MGVTTSPITSQFSCERFPLGTASSTISRMNSGGSSASREATAMHSSTPAVAQTYGRR